jgi:NIMA (never in mitosis gene a)-related kinase
LQFSEPPVGEGTSGVVYRGVYMNDKEVAIKKIKHIEVLSAAEKSSFLREVSLSRMFSCPQIVEFLGCVISPTNLLLVSEFVPHGNLKNYLRDTAQLSLRFKLRCMLDAAIGLAYLHHHHIMHRDVKTDNALVFSLDVNAQTRIKITDFGASKIVKDKVGRARTRIGTPIYVSPEVMRGESYGFSTDVYSLGIMMWEIVEQKEPYEHLTDSSAVMFSVVVKGERPPLLPGHFPPSLSQLVSKCWDADPLKRPEISTICSDLNGIINSDELMYS